MSRHLWRRGEKWQDWRMTIIVMIVILFIAIVPVALVLRSKRRRLSTRASGEPAHTDAASTLRLGDAGAASAAGAVGSWTPSGAAKGLREDLRPAAQPGRKANSKDAAAASDPKSTLKLS